jgi:DNA-binding MarR family transcriptional regulator
VAGDEDLGGAISSGRLTWALRRAELAVQAAKERRLRPLGMLAAHYSLLISVHAAPGPTGAELARRLGVTPQAVASLAAKLEERGLIERRQHPRHRHVQELHLTDAGRDALRAADRVVADIEGAITEKLGRDSSAALTAMLDSVVAAVDNSGHSPMTSDRTQP